MAQDLHIKIAIDGQQAVVKDVDIIAKSLVRAIQQGVTPIGTMIDQTLNRVNGSVKELSGTLTGLFRLTTDAAVRFDQQLDRIINKVSRLRSVRGGGGGRRVGGGGGGTGGSGEGDSNLEAMLADVMGRGQFDAVGTRYEKGKGIVEEYRNRLGRYLTVVRGLDGVIKDFSADVRQTAAGDVLSEQRRVERQRQRDEDRLSQRRLNSQSKYHSSESDRLKAAEEQRQKDEDLLSQLRIKSQQRYHANEARRIAREQEAARRSALAIEVNEGRRRDRQVDRTSSYVATQSRREQALEDTLRRTGITGPGTITKSSDKSVTTEFTNALGARLKVVRDLDGQLMKFSEELKSSKGSRSAEDIQKQVAAIRDSLRGAGAVPLTLRNLFTGNALNALTGQSQWQFVRSRRFARADGTMGQIETYENTVTKARANLNTATGAFTESVGKTTHSLRGFWGGLYTASNKVVQFANVITGIYSASQLIGSITNTLRSVFRDATLVFRYIANITEEGRQFDIGVGGVAGSILTARDIRRQLVIQSRSSPLTISEMLEGGRSAAFQPSLAPSIAAGNATQSATTMRQYTELLARLERLSPEQGIIGVGIAVREFLSGEARSIRFRLEIPPELIYQTVNKSQREVLGDPKLAFEALQKFSRVYVGDRAFYEQANLFSTSVNKVKDAIKQAAMDVGDAGVYDSLTSRFKAVSHVIFDYLDTDFKKQAPRISNALAGVFDTTLETILSFVRGLTGAKDDMSSIKSIGDVITKVLEGVREGVKLLPWVAEQIGWFITSITELVKGAAEFFGVKLPKFPERPGVMSMPGGNDVSREQFDRINSLLATPELLKRAAEHAGRGSTIANVWAINQWVSKNPPRKLDYIESMQDDTLSRVMRGADPRTGADDPYARYMMTADRSQKLDWPFAETKSPFIHSILGISNTFEAERQAMTALDKYVRSQEGGGGASRGNYRVSVGAVARALDNAINRPAEGTGFFRSEKDSVLFQGESATQQAIEAIRELTHEISTNAEGRQFTNVAKYDDLLKMAQRRLMLERESFDNFEVPGTVRELMGRSGSSLREIFDPGSHFIQRSIGGGVRMPLLSDQAKRMFEARVGDTQGDLESIQQLPDVIDTFIKKLLASQLERVESASPEVRPFIRSRVMKVVTAMAASIGNELGLTGELAAKLIRDASRLPLGERIRIEKSDHEWRMNQIASGTIGMFDPESQRVPGSLRGASEKAFSNRFMGTGHTAKQEIDSYMSGLDDRYREALRTGNIPLAIEISVDYESAQKARDDLDDFKNGVLEFTTETRSAITQGFGQAFASIISGTGDVGDAFKNMYYRIVDIFADIQARNLMNALFGGVGATQPTGQQGLLSGLFSFIPGLFASKTLVSAPAASAITSVTGGIGAGLGNIRFAGGGVIPGPHGAGDIIPVMASPGEVILNRSQQSYAASKYGLNMGDVLKNAPRFAGGGYVPYGGTVPGTGIMGGRRTYIAVKDEADARRKGYDPSVSDFVEIVSNRAVEKVGYEARPSGKLNKVLRKR